MTKELKKVEGKEVPEKSPAEVKSAMEIALERAAHLQDEVEEPESGGSSAMTTFEEIKKKADQAEELLTQLKYKQAEFENFKKRTVKEKEELIRESVPVRDLLEILDQLDRALESEGNAEAIKQGVGLTRASLWTLLERRGMERIPGEGEPFDPNHHEAVASRPHETIPEGAVAIEFQPGFKIGDRVVRPSKVVVSSGPPAEG